MKISKKCQYALRAVFELAWRDQDKPVRTQKIAESQRISLRFMEIILNELKHGGFVESKRGNDGGYMLAQPPQDLTVRRIIEYIEGPISLADGSDDVKLIGNEAFTELWQDVNNAIAGVCVNNTFAGLVESERAKRNNGALNYSI